MAGWKSNGWFCGRFYIWVAAALFIATFIAYVGAFDNGYIWDDNLHVTGNKTLQTLTGLWRIWFEPGSFPQYYPVTLTTFWIEYQFWGLDPTAYHVSNVVLHACNALLLAAILNSLRLPGAWLAAALFALHPVHVESVAWISERKNTLSGLLYLLSVLAYLRATALGRGSQEDTDSFSLNRVFYAASIGFFLAAMLSKTVTATLPAVLLLLVWLQYGRLPRRHVLLVSPLFCLGLGLGIVSIWMEQAYVGAQGAEWDYSLGQRCVVAGRALWFYAGKLLWPDPLIFVYPRWTPDSIALWHYFFPVAAVALPLGLLAARSKLGRGPLVAVLFFGGTLVPALGFFNVYPHRYSFVADHFQYLASIGPLALFAALATLGFRRFPSRFAVGGWVLAALVLVLLGSVTYRQTAIYEDAETLWRDTLAKNPDAAIAHNNLGVIFAGRGNVTAAIEEYGEALRLKPGDVQAHNNLGTAMLLLNRPMEALNHYKEALEVEPDNPEVNHNVGLALARVGDLEGAIRHYEKALRRRPNEPDFHNNLGVALAKQGLFDAAAREFEETLRRDPGHESAKTNLGKLGGRR